MLIEFDADKSARTEQRRGFSFELAAAIFGGPTLRRPDLRFDYGEERILAVGEVDQKILVVVYTDRGEIRRIISARRANRKERKQWLTFVNR